MKILRLFLIISILMNSAVLLAQENEIRLTVVEAEAEDYTILAGDIINLEVEIVNPVDEFFGFQLDIPIPDGFEVVDGTFALLRVDGHTFTTVMDNGNYRIVAAPSLADPKPFTGNEGAVATFQLQTPAVPGDDYFLNIVDPIISDADGVALDLVEPVVPAVVFKLTGNEITIIDTYVVINQIVTIEIEIDNYQEFAGFQLDIVLPQGFEYQAGTAQLTGRETNHLFNAVLIQTDPDGEDILRLFANPPLGGPIESFQGSGGVVAQFDVLAQPAQGGWYVLEIQDPIISDADGVDILTQANNGTVEVDDGNTIIVHDNAGKTNEVITIDIEIDNSFPVAGFQTDITLPQGFTFIEGTAVLSDREDGHSLTAVLIESDPEGDDILRITASPALNMDGFKNFKGFFGVVVSFDVQLPNEPGEYTLDIENSVISLDDATEIEGVIEVPGTVIVELEIRLAFMDILNACANQPFEVGIELLNSRPAAAFQTVVDIPEGFDFLYAELNPDRAPAHSFNATFNAETRELTIVVFSFDAVDFIGVDGNVISFYLQNAEPIDDTVTDIPLALHSTIISDNVGVAIQTDDEDDILFTIHPEPDVMVEVQDEEGNPLDEPFEIYYNGFFQVSIEGVAGQGPWTVFYSILGPENFDDIVDAELGTGDAAVIPFDLDVLNVPPGMYTFLLTGLIDDNGCAATQETLDAHTFEIEVLAQLEVFVPDPVTLGPCPEEDIQTAYNDWVAGFFFTGDSNAVDNIDEIPELPDNAYCEGADLEFEYIVTGTNDQVSESSTFTVIAPDPLVVNVSDAVDLDACTPEEVILAAYDAWVEGFNFTGDCNADDNKADIPELPDNFYCEGVDLTFEYIVTGDCETGGGVSTFVVAAPAELEANVPEPVLLSPCTPLAQIQAAYDNWKAGFNFSGDCNAVDNSAAIPMLQANLYCNGITLEFTYEVEGDCDSFTGFSSFVVLAPEALVVNVPDPVNLDACTSEEDIMAAYDAWVAGFSFTGDCNADDNIADIPELPADVFCNGASLEFQYEVSGDCYSDTGFSTFDVAAPADLVVNVPGDVLIEACAEDIEAQYAMWVGGFSFEGGCDPQDNINEIPVLPEDAYCNGANLSFTYVVSDECDSGGGTSSFVVVAPDPLVVNVPPVDEHPACTPLDDIVAAYEAWVAGFTFEGDCNATDNLDELPGLPENPLCEGVNIEFTYVVTGDCDSGSDVSSFVVAAPEPLVINVAPAQFHEACTSVEDIEDAYAVWVAGFGFTGDCNATDNIVEIPALPADPLCEGVALFFEYVVTGDCGSDSGMSSFVVATPDPLVVNVPPVESHPACTPVDDIVAAYNAWVAGFGFEGDCDVTDNVDQIPALPVDPICEGVNIVFEYVVTGICATESGTSSFVVEAAQPLVVNIPEPVYLLPCADDIQEQYDAWVAGFGFSGDCNVTDNIDEIPALPADAFFNGADLEFTYVVTGDCDADQGTSTFFVEAPDLVVITPDPVDLPACTPMADIVDAYEAWVAGFSFSGDCNGSDNIEDIPALPEDYCEGIFIEFTYLVEDDITSDSGVSTFTVEAPEALVVNVPEAETHPACTPVDAIQAAYAAWVAGFNFTGDCDVTDNIADIPALPENPLCEGVDISFTYVVEGVCETDSGTSTFFVAVPEPLVVTVPAPQEHPACTPMADIQAAYNAWVAGFGYTGDCNVTDNIADIPALPADYCEGVNISFTYIAEGDCFTDSDVSTFVVAAPAPLVVTVPAPQEHPACTPVDDIQAAYAAWVAGFGFTGDCNVSDNLAEIPGLPEDFCEGVDISFTYIAEGDCFTDSDVSTFVVAAPAPLVVTVPAPEEHPACTPLADIQAAYAAWVAGFGFTGDCNVTDNIEEIPALPADPLCGGVDISFTYTASGDCYSDSGTSTFVVAVPEPLDIVAPEDFFGLTTDFTGQEDVDDAFASWLAEFAVSGGCEPVGDFVGEPVAPDWTGGSVEVTFAVTDVCEDGDVTATFTIVSTDKLSGVVSYYKHNAENIPMSGDVTVSLLDAEGNVLASTQTDVGGFYEFDYSEAEVNLLLQTAFVEVSTTIPHGGLRGADALAVQNRAINIFAPFWEPVDFLDHVANVIYTAGSGPGELPNIVDAASIQQRFVFPGNFETFMAGNWAFFAPDLPGGGVVFDNLATGPEAGRIAYNPLFTVMNIEARAFGDVRGDYVPMAGGKTLLPIHTDEVMVVGMNEVFELPVTTLFDMTFSAMSMDLHYDVAKIEVIALHTDIPGALYSINEGNIRVVFADAFNQQMLEKGDAVITLEARTIAPVSPGDVLFTSSDETEFSDELAMPLSFFEIGVTRLDNVSVNVVSPEDSGIAISAYPNPFRDALNLNYAISAPGMVQITIVNAMGAKVAELVNEVHEAGTFSTVFYPETSNFQRGMYFIRMEVQNDHASYNEVLRIVYVK